ncbi:thiamine-phosphate diphosphorylase [Niastella yeongjuensis]|uniref:Thiamine-phosphate synthase n=1 Tax=Niastella yeongjuensis TaxID=354355 RepID=A0A1V9DY97_9BACT|nr:thiamine phosphate synthase [Niastella yeongjuensis]OQP38810.1 thiamine-phosphate diphosphorylase [Niastella yeongjuensis]SEO31698.1 thiamine-phosphate diphosphorylase [Niastella yeongjuensis]
MLERVYFISQQTTTKTHLAAIEDALTAGCKLIQLRVKNQPEAVVLELAKAAKALCDRYNAKLIINDFPKVARAVNAWGVHVGLQDMAVSDVRAIVGSNMIVGGTANTFEHIQQRVLEGVDYIGLGPFRFTTTKEKLSPVLGLEGYQHIMNQMRAAAIYTPIVAIGGILPDDVPGLRDAGIYGVALSGAITNVQDKQQVVKQISDLYL